MPGDSFVVYTSELEGNFSWQVLEDGNLLSQDDSLVLKPASTSSYTIETYNATCQYADEFNIQIFGGTNLPDTIIKQFCPGDTAHTLEANYYGFIDWQWDGALTGNND